MCIHAIELHAALAVLAPREMLAECKGGIMNGRGHNHHVNLTCSSALWLLPFALL